MPCPGPSFALPIIILRIQADPQGNPHPFSPARANRQSSMRRDLHPKLAFPPGPRELSRCFLEVQLAAFGSPRAHGVTLSRSRRIDWLNHVPSIPSLPRYADVTVIPKARWTTRSHATSHEPQQLHTMQLAVVPCVSCSGGGNNHQSLWATSLFTGWRGIGTRRSTSAIVLGSYQACCSVCPVEGSAELYPACWPTSGLPVVGSSLSPQP